MAIYLGKEEFLTIIDSINKKSLNNIKGLKAEKEIGDMLENLLPDDTYIIAHPQIGKYDPDFIIISPRYGFRIIEVKNWNPSSIASVESNGTFILKNGHRMNPLTQAKKHRDEFRDYLTTNHKIYGVTVDCVVIHYGMTLKQFKEKYDDGSWNEDFYKLNLFRDDINEGIDQKLETSTKFRINVCSNSVVKNIISSLKISKNILSDEYYILEEKVKEEHSVKKLNYVIISMLLIVLVFIGVLFIKLSNDQSNIQISNNKTNDYYTTVEDIISNYNNGDEIETALRVEEFNYDNSSETKFLLLSDDDDHINGVIFKGVSGIPYIEEGNMYLIRGTLKEYNLSTEICIEYMEQLK